MCTLPRVFFRYDQHQDFSIGVMCLLGNNHPWLLLENQFLKKKDLLKIKTTQRYKVIRWFQYIFTAKNQTFTLNIQVTRNHLQLYKKLRKQLKCKLFPSNDNTKYFALKKKQQ